MLQSRKSSLSFVYAFGVGGVFAILSLFNNWYGAIAGTTLSVISVLVTICQFIDRHKKVKGIMRLKNFLKKHYISITIVLFVFIISFATILNGRAVNDRAVFFKFILTNIFTLFLWLCSIAGIIWYLKDSESSQ